MWVIRAPSRVEKSGCGSILRFPELCVLSGREVKIFSIIPPLTTCGFPSWGFIRKPSVPFRAWRTAGLCPQTENRFYHLDPEAAYSDGRIVKAQDFLLNICLRTSGFARDPFWTTLFRSMYDQITVYGDSVIALTLPSRGPLLPYMACADFHPAHPGFTMISTLCFWNATSGKSLQIRVATWLFSLKSG